MTKTQTRELVVLIQNINLYPEGLVRLCKRKCLDGKRLDGFSPQVVLALGDYMNVQCHSCIGGTNLGEDIRKLDYGQHVVSGTPGRVFDMIRRRTLRTRGIKMLVLDEADEMLNKGFKEQIYDVYRYLPPATQVILQSTNIEQ